MEFLSDKIEKSIHEYNLSEQNSGIKRNKQLNVLDYHFMYKQLNVSDYYDND
jgi:hypothetical protein